ncbi:unnamed protein product [Sympodiomycopsis kandeliae]
MSTTKRSQDASDALVLGGGFAGLIAAIRLVEADNSVVLVEARSRLGGRAFTHTFSNETLGSSARTVPAIEANDANVVGVDFGCSWIHGYFEGNPVKKMCEDLQIPVATAKQSKTNIVGPSGNLETKVAQQLQDNLTFALQSAQASASLRTPSSASLASYLFQETSPLFRSLESEHLRAMARAYARQLQVPLGVSLEKAALRWTGFEQNFAGTDAAPEGGFSRVISALADLFISKGGRILLEENVEKIRWVQKGSETVQVTARNADNIATQLSARAALVTFPVATLKKSARKLFDPPLTQRKLDAIDRVNVGNLNKVMLVYSSSWWDTNIGTFTILPDCTVDSHQQNAAALLSSITLVVSAQESRLLVMIGAEAGAAIEEFSREDVVDALHTYLSRRLGRSGTAPPSHSFMSRWSGHHLTGGATTTPVVVGNDRSPLDFDELSRPECSGRLGFAGEHTDMHHRGSIAGAVLSGEREARRLIGILQKDADQW